MSTYTGPEAAKAFTQYLEIISGESDRGAILVAATLLDEGLEKALKKKLVEPAKQDPLFAGGFAPLRSFAAKIELSFRLGLITRETRQMLDLFRDLRNDCAHGTDPVSLNDQRLQDRMRGVFNHLAPIHAALVITFEEILREEKELKMTIAEFLATDRGRRAIFNTFFAVNAMALRRMELEVDRTAELTSPDQAGPTP